jgi:D-aminoacyl-tRNA deacylase
MIFLFTKHNVASANIARALIEEHGFEGSGEGEWRHGPIRLIDTGAPSVLEVPCDYNTDLLVVLSTHRSKIKEKVMTAHFPGNWGEAEMGGESRTLNVAAPGRLKLILQEIGKEAGRIGWNTMLEADHHGPTGNVPMIFAEIGSGEEEWADREAASAMARALMSAAGREGRFEAFFGVGGGHYPRAFTKMVLEGPMAVGHIAPKYVIDKMDEDLFRQAIEKSTDPIGKVIIMKDETNQAQKEKMAALAGKTGLVIETI